MLRVHSVAGPSFGIYNKVNTAENYRITAIWDAKSSDQTKIMSWDFSYSGFRGISNINLHRQHLYLQVLFSAGALIRHIFIFFTIFILNSCHVKVVYELFNPLLL